MPLYEYQCKQCGHRFEKIQSFTAPDEKTCPECGAEVERLISAPAIQFKGAGWYVNDYAGRNKAPSSGGADSSKDGGKDVAGKSTESTSKAEGGKSDSSSKSDSGAASTNSGSSAASSSNSRSSTKSSD